MNTVKIGINTTSAVAGGGVTYLVNLIKQLYAFDGENKYYIYATIKSSIQECKNSSANFEWLTYKFPSINPIFRIFWEQFILPVYLKINKVQILLCPANIGLIFSQFPYVLVVQNVAMFNDDLIRREKSYQKIRLLLLRALTKYSIKKAKKVIFISKASQKAICEKYSIGYEKTTVIYHGNEDHFHSCQNQVDGNKIKSKYKLNKYLLFVSNIYQFKNFYELILSFIKIKDKIDKNIKLVFAGVSFDDLYYKKLKKVIYNNGCENRIQFLDHVPTDELPYLYANSILYVYPSTIESFGKTLIEAMGCGASVIASNIEPIPEVCQDAALYFNPNDPDDIADKMFKVLGSDDLQLELSKKAVERAKFFSWEKTARETLKVLEAETCNE